MSDAMSGIAERAAELREDFDRAFAEPIHIDATIKEALLAIRIGTQPLALRLSEIAGLVADKKITHIPGSHAAMRGIAGFRGSMLPVYDLQALLGRSRAQAPRWLVIAAAAPVAVAFDAFAGQLRVAQDEILPQPGRQEAAAYAREFVRTQDFAGPILHLPSILAAIRSLKGEPTPEEE